MTHFKKAALQRSLGTLEHYRGDFEPPKRGREKNHAGGSALPSTRESSAGPFGYAPIGPLGYDSGVLGLICRVVIVPVGSN